MKDHIIETNVCVNNRPVREFENNGLYWVEAREGSKYAIRIKNNSYTRKLVIVSVDGINIITGEPAVATHDSGYIVDGKTSIMVEGWRISDNSVKEFVFSFNKDKSYAVKLGQGKENLGVIGILVYDELQSPLSYPIYKSYSGFTGDPITYNPVTTCGMPELKSQRVDCMSFAEDPINLSGSVTFQAGTGKGEEIPAPVITIDFKPGVLVASHSYYYDSWKNLKKRGVIIEAPPKLPQAFAKKYCPDI